jgi:hypothetical protein
MPKKKKYKYYLCKECEIDFVVAEKLPGKPYCPQCAESMFVEKLKEVWMERPFNYKRPWSPEEDETVLVSLKQGFSYEEISEALIGRTGKSVKRRYQLLTSQRRNG